MPVTGTVAGQGGTAIQGSRGEVGYAEVLESGGRAPGWVQGRLLEGWSVVVGKSFG